MNKNNLGIIFITALITFWGTRLLFEPTHEEHHGEYSNHNDHAEHHDHAGHTDGHESELSLTAELLKEFDIRIATAAGGILEKTIELPGEIQIDPDRLAHITPRFDGVVQEVFKQIGDHVKKDELLAIIESNESLMAYELRSSINGIVIDMHFTKGETAQRPDHFFAVADLSEVWVNLSVYQKNLPQMKIGQTANILLGAGIPQVTGSISYISPTLDEHTRTATARVILKNRKSLYRPGQFVTGEVIIDRTYCSTFIPKTALETVNGLLAVFIKNEHGFEPSIVIIGKENQHSVEILSGLNAGDEYVMKGGFFLKAQMAKGSFGDGHNH